MTEQRTVAARGDYRNKRVFVTGGIRGIGLACAERFAAGGAELVLNYRRDDDTAGESAPQPVGGSRSERRAAARRNKKKR